jgi:linoleoyl-CoA desaturase
MVDVRQVRAQIEICTHPPWTRHHREEGKTVSTPYRKITFENRRNRDFGTEIHRRVNAYFEERQLSRHANASMVVKTVVLLGLYVGAYGLIVSAALPLWGMWLMCVVMGVGMAGIGFNIGHDALHGAYSSRKWVNKGLGLSFDLVGANGCLWKIIHNVAHHTYTNIDGHDQDLDIGSFIRLSPHREHRWIHRFQHVLAFIAYSLATLFWVFIKDYKFILQKNIGPYEDKKHPLGEWVMLVTTKAFYYGYTIAVPLMVLDLAWWQFLMGFLTFHLTAGLILGVVFQLAHVVEGTDFPQPDSNARIEENWLIHQMHTTSNFARNNALVTWYLGGLNFQIEHHLFPRICSIHYPQIAPIVEATAREYGVPYHEHPGFVDAIRSHYRILKRFGRRDSPCFDREHTGVWASAPPLIEQPSLDQWPRRR